MQFHEEIPGGLHLVILIYIGNALLLLIHLFPLLPACQYIPADFFRSNFLILKESPFNLWQYHINPGIPMH